MKCAIGIRFSGRERCPPPPTNLNNGVGDCRICFEEKRARCIGSEVEAQRQGEDDEDDEDGRTARRVIEREREL